jgi:hypothetical protein
VVVPPIPVSGSGQHDFPSASFVINRHSIYRTAADEVDIEPAGFMVRRSEAKLNWDRETAPIAAGMMISKVALSLPVTLPAGNVLGSAPTTAGSEAFIAPWSGYRCCVGAWSVSGTQVARRYDHSCSY